MELLEDTKQQFKVDRSEWQPIKFGQVAIQKKENVDRDDTDLTLYVKGEHMQSEDLHIRQWGELSDEYLGPAFIRRFNEGDILYGSRRTYLRKVAIAPFDGITSNTTFVVNANEKLIVKDLLPFVMLSEGFAQHSIKNSKGSVNPYINWKDISHYGFLLPPKNQQFQLAELLWTADKMIERQLSLKSKAIHLKDSLIYFKCLNNPHSKEFSLSEIIDKLESGVSVNSEDGALTESDYGILKTSSVSSGFFVPEEAKKVLNHEIVRLRTSVKQNSIIISRMNTVELVGANAYVSKDYDNLFLPDRLWQTVISSEKVIAKYLWYLLSSQSYRKQISDLCTGTSNSMKNISQKAFLELTVKLPSRDIQETIVAEIESIEKAIAAIDSKVNSSRQLQKLLINQIF